MSLDIEFLTALATIISIDIILGGDNAIVVALACRNLPTELRNRAIVLGIGFAIVARIILTLLAVYLLKIPLLMAIGGALLLYIAFHLISDNSHEHNRINGKTTVFAAIKTIIIADIVMGTDNVLAVAGAAHGNMLLVVIGLFVSVPIIIWGSKIILAFMQRFPVIIYIGAAILAFTATKMIVHEPMLAPLIKSHQMIANLLQIFAIIIILIAGWFSKQKQENTYF